MWSNLEETADLVTLTEEILNGKLQFLCTAIDINKFLNTPLSELILEI